MLYDLPDDVDELVAEVTGEELEATAVVDPDKGNLARTAKILPEFVRM